MDYCVPELGEGVYEAELVNWYVQSGDAVEPGQSLAEVVTDKATMDLPAPFAGQIEQLAVPSGSLVRVGDLLLSYAPSETRAGSNRQPGGNQSRVGHVASGPATRSARVPSPAAGPERAETERPLSGDGQRENRAVKAAPAVRRMASALGVDLRQVAGTGPDGRILIADLAAAAGDRSPRPQRRARSNAMLDMGTAGTRIPVRGLRRQIAEHMLLSKRTIPHYSYVDECDVSQMMTLVGALKKPLVQRQIRLSNLAFFVKAVVAALQEVPLVNSTLEEETAEVVLHEHIHIGIATSTSKGLLVPVIHHADQLRLPEIAREIDKLTRAARDGKLQREQLQGSTFTISSVGTIGGMVTTPIINHPEVAILGVGKTFKRPVYDDEGQIVPANIVYLSFSFDHRVVDGSVGATFGSAVIRHLQNPASLLL